MRKAHICVDFIAVNATILKAVTNINRVSWPSWVMISEILFVAHKRTLANS